MKNYKRATDYYILQRLKQLIHRIIIITLPQQNTLGKSEKKNIVRPDYSSFRMLHYFYNKSLYQRYLEHCFLNDANYCSSLWVSFSFMRLFINFMNIKEHNYSAIAQKTKIAFQLFAKRTLAKQIIKVLQKNKTKKQAIVSQSEIALEIQQNPSESLNEKKYFQQNESHLRNTVHLNKTGIIAKEQKIIKINELKYGDYVTIQMQSRGEIFRIVSCLEGLKLISLKEMNTNLFNLKRAAFQLTNPSQNFKECNESISQVSMICLKNAFTGNYIHFTEKIAKTKEFGYQIRMLSSVGKEGLFVLRGFREQGSNLTTSQDISIGLYYNPMLRLSVSEEKFMGKIDRSLLASYSTAFFKLSKVQNPTNLTQNPFYYIRFSQLSKNLQIQQPTIQRFTQKRQIRQFFIDENQPQQKQVNQVQLQDCKCKIQFFQLSPMRESVNVRLGGISTQGACQIWEVQRIDESSDGWQCRIRSAVTNQQIGNDGKDMQDSFTNFKRNSFLQLRKNGSQFILQNDQSNSLTALYDREYDRYQIKYQQQSSFSGDGSVNKNNSCKIQLIQITQVHQSILCKLLELNDILKHNYEFIQKWGFGNEDRSDSIRLSFAELKRDARLVKMKIEEVNNVLLELKKLLEKEDHASLVQTTSKELKILDLLIMYCQVIKIKMSKPTQMNRRNIFKFTGKHLQSTLLSLFETIFLFTRHNKSCSQVIIENNLIFNNLLQDYCRPIGRIIQQAIKNLCILTNKIIQQQDVIFSWTTHIQQISDPQLLLIQTTYIEIISEVVVDPNDIGIHPYQYKIKEQIIGNRKKKIFPKFLVTNDKLTNSFYPSVVFQYAFFPKQLTGNQNSLETTSKSQSLPVQLRQLFTGRKQISNYAAQIEYLSSILKLMRNLCKDRNKKLAKVMEDYGLTIQFMHYVFKSSEISWEIITKFLDLYCVMYLIQDPFLSFQKRQTKCFAWHKIDSLDFSLKTGMLFNQFTEQHSATQKIKSFDVNILPVFDHYFEDIQNLSQSQWQQEGRQSFYNIVGILYEIIKYGYLNHQSIQKYAHYIVLFSERNLRLENRKERKIELVNKIVKILTISQEIWTIIYSMNLLLLVYKNLKQSKETSLSFLKKLVAKTLEYDSSQLQVNEQKVQIKKRRHSINIRSTLNREQQILQPKRSSIDHSKLDDSIIQFALGKLLQTQLVNANSIELKSLLRLLEMISKRGDRICYFLDEVFILNSQEEENIYHQYSGIAPIGVQNQSIVSRRLLNVMKMKELVDKIMEDSVELQDQSRKREKIAELSNLLSKVTKNMQAMRNQNNRLFKVSQIVIRKLGFHEILIEVLKRWEKQSYQVLINTIISFLLEFVRENEKNSEELAKYFQMFTKKYSFQRLPQLLSILFTKNGSKEEDFCLVYKNIDKKIDNSQKQILFQSIYNLLKASPEGRLKKVKGHVIYNLITNSKFEDYIRGTVQSPNFINIVCCVGWSSQNLQQRIKECVSKTELFTNLASKSNNFILKAMTLKIYYFLYISRGQMDETECQQLVQKVFFEQIKHLPSSCQARASTRIQQLKSSIGDQMQQESSSKISSIIAQYGQLMMKGNDQVSTSQQENYFLYLLNIQDQNQLSLLSCLQEVLIRYNIAGIDSIASYIFKLISFMERIFMKQEKVYQSRILNKLYEISTVIQERYNRSPKIQAYFSFEVAYKKAEVFFRHFAQIIQQQNLGFSKIIKSAKITYKEIQRFRNDVKVQKLILQSQFLSFIRDICSVINDRSSFDLKISQASIKEFFIIYSQKGTHKMNIIKFITKLMQILEHQKSVKLYNHIMQSRKNESQRQSRNDERNQSSIMNYELLMGEIVSIQQTYNSHLWECIPNKIKWNLQKLLPSNQQKYNRVKIYNMIATHLNNNQFSIMPLIVFQIIANKSEQVTDLQSIDEKLVGDYFQMLSLEIDRKMKGFYSLQIIKSLYESFQRRSKQKDIFYSNIMKVFTNALRNLAEDKIQFNSRVCSNYAILYNLLSETLKCEDIPPQDQQNLELIILKTLKDCISLYCETKSDYWIHHAITIIEIILSSYTKYSSLQRIAKNIAEDTQFINKIRMLITNTIKSGMRSTNIRCQLSVKMMNNFFRLFKKLRAHNFQHELEQIITKFPLKSMFHYFQQNYHYFHLQEKKTSFCQMQIQCSLQYCNEGKKSAYDSYISQVYMNLLLMVNVALDLISLNSSIFKSMPQQQKHFIVAHKQPKQVPDHRQGLQLTNSAPFMKSIQVVLSGQDQIFYFHTTMAESSRDFLIKKQIQQGLKHIDGNNYYSSLYNLSIYVEQLEQCVRLINKGFVYKHILNNFAVYQIFVLVFLLFLCFSLAFSFQIPLIIILTFNTMCLSTKIIGFSFQIKLFYYLFFVLKDIKYNKSLIFEKCSSILLSLIAIICYCSQYTIQQIYPFTLLIQILKLKTTKQMILLLWTGISQMTFSILVMIVMIICSTFIIFDEIQNIDQNETLFSVFMGTFKQTQLFQFLPVNPSDQNDYKYITKIPEVLPIMNFLNLYIISVVIAIMLKKLNTDRQFLEDSETRCGVCGLRKSSFEQKGLDFKKHIRTVHNYWNYIDFFIYLRRKIDKERQQLEFVQLIENKDFRFLRT